MVMATSLVVQTR